MARVYLSLGSNLGDRLEHLRRAVEFLRGMPDVTGFAVSRVYQTEPWEVAPGEDAGRRAAWFYNCVVMLETSAPPRALLERCQTLERAEGRERGPGTPEDRRYEPRPLDVDILLYGDQVISAPESLQVPHLLMHERAFVLRPLAELAPDLEHPTLYERIRDLADALEDEHGVEPLLDLPARWFEP